QLAGISEGKLDELLNFETSDSYSERERAALAYAEAITWRLDPDDAFWERLHQHFTEPELVELGYFIALTMGLRSWPRASSPPTTGPSTRPSTTPRTTPSTEQRLKHGLAGTRCGRPLGAP